MNDVDPWLAGRMGGTGKPERQSEYKVRDTRKLIEQGLLPEPGSKKRSRSSRRAAKASAARLRGVSAPGDAVAPADARAARRRGKRNLAWAPNQHGAWAMLALPFLTGTVLGVRDHGFTLVTIPLAGLWFAGFLAYHAIGLLLKSRRRPSYRRPAITYAAIAAVFAAAVVALDWRLLWWAPAFVPLVGFGLWATSARKERTLLADTALVVAATAMVPVAYLACRPEGTLPSLAVVPSGTPLIAATALVGAYLFGTVLYVKTMIRERGVRSYLVGSILYHFLVTLLVFDAARTHGGWWWAVLALYAALTVRAVVLPDKVLTPKQVGLIEIAASVAVFAAAVVI